MNRSKRQNVLSLSRQKNGISTPRNSFDMSYHSKSTSPAGMLLPVYREIMNPGDMIEINSSHLTRTQPVNTAAMTRYQENVEFFFVPIRLLWQQFDQFITASPRAQTALFAQSADANTVYKECPYIASSTIADFFAKEATPDAQSYVDAFGFSKFAGVARMLDLLGYPVPKSSHASSDIQRLYDKQDTNIAGDPVSTNYDRKFNIFYALAYQRIFADHFRNEDWSPNDPTAYNIDDVASGAITSDTSPSGRFVKLFQPHYVQWRRDRFTAIKPSTLGFSLYDGMGSGTAVDYLNEMMPKHINGLADMSQAIEEWATERNTLGGQGLADTVESLRAFLAFDKLQRVKALAGKRYQDQFKAVFGTSIEDKCTRARYLGSYNSMVNIGEVTATSSGTSAGGSSNVLGQLAGKGFSTGNSKQIRYEAQEHGIILGISYIVPFSEYDSQRLDESNTWLRYNDFFNPAYDNLGFQPLESTSLYYSGNYDPSHEDLSVVGFTPRYSALKTRVDEIHGEFQSGRTLKHWNSPRSVVLGGGGSFFADFYVNPAITDSLFPLAYNGTEVTDPFMRHFSFEVRKLSNMSVLGIPNI